MSEHQLIAPNPIHAPLLGSPALPAASLPQHKEDVDYLTILAHDLRNYLTPVSAQLAVLHTRAQREQRDLDLRAAARGRQALDYALLLITNLLDATRMERGLFELTREPLNLSLVVQQVVEVFETNYCPIVLCVPETVVVCADRERLRQVLHNLLANALTYSPRGMPITLDMHIEQREGTKWGVLMVCNSGPAIPPHLLPQIFQRFTSGRESRGLGLGLYLARGIAEAHDGALTAYSKDGVGTCFMLALPLCKDSAEAGD